MTDRVADLLFLVAIIAPIIVIFWSFKHDRLPESDETTGLIAMKKVEDSEDTA